MWALQLDFRWWFRAVFFSVTSTVLHRRNDMERGRSAEGKSVDQVYAVISQTGPLCPNLPQLHFSCIFLF